MQKKFVDKLIEKITVTQEAVQNLLEVEGSLNDVSEIPSEVVEKCDEFLNWLEIWNTKLKAGGGE